MTDLSGKRILIAGGTGTVGRYLVQAALDAGATVIIPSRSTGKAQLGTIYILGDITDPRDGARIIAEAGRIDGAIVSIGRWITADHVLDPPRADFERALAN